LGFVHEEPYLGKITSDYRFGGAPTFGSATACNWAALLGLGCIDFGTSLIG